MLRRTCSMRPQRQPSMRHQGLSMGRKHLETLVYSFRLWMLIFVKQNPIQNIHSYHAFLIDLKQHHYLIYLLQILITMNAEFFRQRRPRVDNPTFQSNLVQSSMLFPISKHDILKMKSTQNTNNIISNQSINSNRNTSTIAQMPNSSRNIYDYNNFQMSNFPKNNSVILENSATNDPFRFKRSKSFLSSYGSNSLSNLKKVNDKQIFESQQKDFNIVNLCPKQYKQSIKMFPKFRNQIRADESNRIRQAFISGKPQIGLAKSKMLNQQTHKNQSMNTYKSLSKLNPEKAH